MALTCAELIEECKAALGRGDDTTLITDDRVMRWLNKAQEEIAEQCPGLVALDFKNTTSVDFTTVLKYALSDFTSPLMDVTTENRICHIYRAYYQDGDESRKLQYVPLDEFDDRYIDPTSDDFYQGVPKYYTRRGGYIETYPVCSTAEQDKTFRLDGSVYPADFTATNSTASSTLDRADDLLIAYAVFKAWSYIGKGDTAAAWFQKFEMLLEDYKRRNNVMHEWDANLFGEWI